MQRHHHGRRAHRREKRRTPRLPSLLLAGALLFYLLFLCERQMRPVLNNVISYECRYYAARAFNNAVLESVADHPESYRTLYDVTRAENGSILSVEANAYEVNILRAQLVEAVNAQLDNVEQDTIRVPLGTLTGVQALAGFGPRIPLRILPESYVTADIRDRLEDAGVNQVKLSLYVDFSMDMSIVLPGWSGSVQAGEEIFLGQILLVGNTPNYYHAAG